MRRILAILALAATLQGADVVDRIAVTAKLKVVTVGEIRRYIRIISTLEGTDADYTAANLRRVAELLINQRLIANEMMLSGYGGVPMSAIEQPLQSYLKARGATYEDLLRIGAASGLSEEEIRREFRWRYSVNQFVLYRFRPVVQVSDEEVDAYYAGTYAKRWAESKPNEALPALADVREDLVNRLEDEKVDALVKSWLEEQQRLNNVVYREEALR
jgi:parvulin-like peptidyl-prolyl isomerase